VVVAAGATNIEKERRLKPTLQAKARATNMDVMEFTLGLALLASTGLHAQAVNWRIDPLHSSAQFSVKHLMISTVRGQFGGVKGTVAYDPKNPEAATVDATIDCTTVNTSEPKRDADLKTAEFFDVKKYPVMKFKSKHVETAGAGKLKVTGDLTINAVTREVVLDLEGPSAQIRDAQGRDKVGVSGVTKISRKEFGILYNPILETGGVTVSDEVSIILEIELIKN
jgi:polyisoprenoid-binding protein YceI